MKDKERYFNDKEFADKLARRLQQLRYERGYTQEVVIDKLHLGINRYETGDSIPLLMSLVKICDFYNITLDEFFAPMNYPAKK